MASGRLGNGVVVSTREEKRQVTTPTLADILPPDIGDGTGATAVNTSRQRIFNLCSRVDIRSKLTFSLVLSDDYIGNRCTGCQNEDSIGFASLCLSLAYTTFGSQDCETQGVSQMKGNTLLPLRSNLTILPSNEPVITRAVGSAVYPYGRR